MSDINIGALSEAINDKMDRDAQNVDTTAGADVVIEFQVPTSSNNYTWYRKYKSGWVEQGGYYKFSSTSYATFNLIITMADTNYTVQATFRDSTAAANNVYGINTGNYTTTTFVAKNGINGSNAYFNWEAKGMYAQ